MELRHLRCFLAVAEELHFARIAERLHIDQSLLSRTIKELDKGLHDDLYDAGFSRAEDAGDGIVVTPAWEDELMMAVPARHPVLAFKQVPTKEVLRYPLTLGDPAICEGHACQIDRFLRTCGQEPLIAQYVATVDVMLVLVSAGLALGAAEVAENALQMGRSDTFALNSLRSLTPLPTASTVCGLWASALMTWPQNYRLQSWRCVSSQKQSIAAGQQTIGHRGDFRWPPGQCSSPVRRSMSVPYPPPQPMKSTPCSPDCAESPRRQRVTPPGTTG